MRRFLVSIQPVLSKVLIALGIYILMMGVAYECINRASSATPPECRHVTRERTLKGVRFDVDSLLSAYEYDTLTITGGVESRWRWNDETMLVIDSVDRFVFYSFKRNDYVRCPFK
jgi:hypothetical protein